MRRYKILLQLSIHMEKEFIYLIPGNWFELKNIIANKTTPYDLQMFKDEILLQVNNRAEKLSFIDLKHGTPYPNAIVEHISVHFDNKKFKQIAKILEKEQRHPMITFHGTKPESVDSIIAHGYQIPGKNKLAKLANGSAYGIGIYSSPFFEKANYYARPDDKGYIYILINLLFPGKAKLISPGEHDIDRNHPINGCYDNGFNTRIVYGLDQIVTADPNRIIPIAVMKINTILKK